VLAGTTAAAATTAVPRREAAPVPRRQPLALLRHDTGAFADPDPASARVDELSSVRPITSERTVLPVIGHAKGPRGLRWVEVLLPGRPNGHSGWIRQRAAVATFTKWRLVVSLATRTVTVTYGAREMRTFEAVIGKPSTPTPAGRFFVEETVALGAGEPGAPYALALSARSDVLQEFDGGPGQVALHGTSNLSGIPGTAASHGCVRLDTAAIVWLASRIGPGTPVTISAAAAVTPTGTRPRSLPRQVNRARRRPVEAG
jgi:lipoprotein-anchoring transpeptidase ErfK/SrfK